MKILTYCMACFQQDGVPPEQPIEIELVGDEKLIGKCSKGHNVPLAVQQQDFEILFELACMALLDGYSREAVAGAASALERCYIFYVRCAYLNAGTPSEIWEAAWRAMSQQSERQLGAFIALFSFLEKERPPLLDGKWVKFRNDCVHKGLMPTQEKTMEYLSEVMKIIDYMIEITKRKYSIGLQKLIMEHVSSFAVPGMPLTTVGLGTVVSVTRGKEDGPLAARLKDLERRRRYSWTK